jgi:hypothetical protein
MSVQVSDYLSVTDRAAALGCEVASGFMLLPKNFEEAEDRTELIQRSEAATVKTLLRNEGLPFGELLPVNERSRVLVTKSADWIGPLIFIPAALATTDPAAVSVALNVLSSYLVDFFKGMPGSKRARLEFVVERKGDRVCKKLTYEGPPEGIRDLGDTLQGMADE